MPGFFYLHGLDFTGGLDIDEVFDVGADFDLGVCVWIGHSSAVKIFSLNRFEFIKFLLEQDQDQLGLDFAFKIYWKKS